REIGWLFALENPASVDTSLSERVRNVSTVTNEPTLSYKLVSYVTRRHFLSRHQRNNLGAPIVEEWIGGDHEGINTFLVEGGRNGGEGTLLANPEGNKHSAEATRRGLKIRQLRLADRVVGICKHANHVCCRNEFQQKP